MMSAAMLMMASGDQAGAHPVSTDQLAEQGAAHDVSFAKTFSDRIGKRTWLPEESSPEDATTAVLRVKVATPAKKLEEARKTLEGEKRKSVAGQQISGQRGREDAAASRIVQPQTPAVKIAVGDSGTKKVELTAEGDSSADDGSTGLSVPDVQPAAGPIGEGTVVPINISDGVRPLVSHIDPPISQKGTESSGRTGEILSARKDIKAQDGPATPKAVQKTVGTEENTASRAVATTAREDAVPIFQGVATNAQHNDFSKAASDGSINAIVGIASASAEVSFASVHGSPQNETVHSAKADSVNGETVGITAEAQPELSKSDVGREKTAATAISTSNAGDGKVQSAFDPAAAVGHSISASVATSGALTTVPLPGDARGELSVTKLPAGETGAHPTGLLVGAKEVAQPDMIPASIDEIPRTLTATPTALEVGIQNGTHGWLRVRAEMVDGGVVNASVSASSSAGQEMLHRELPALTAYLQEEKVTVNAIVVHTPPAAPEARSSAGTDGAGGQAQQRGNEEGEQQQNLRERILGSVVGAIDYRGEQGVDEDGSLSLPNYASGGGWLSVRA